MPYIPPTQRAFIDPVSETAPAENAGELNFQISRLIGRHFASKGVSYATINEAVGVLECAKLEVYRRIAAPYEDRKLSTNGDVYT